MPMLQQPDKSRIGAALGSAAITALLGYALLTGFGVPIPVPVVGELDVFDITPEVRPPLPKPPPPPRRAHENGASGAPALRAKATEIVAPPPVVPIVIPTIAAAKIADIGTASSTGASPNAGPGTGGGGTGDGYGDGDGGDETPPLLRSGRIKSSDYPRAAFEANAGGTVSVQYTVTTKGRATDCSVTRSSGNVELDRATCRLIEERFRYEPSRDARGRPVESGIIENHSWTVHRDERSSESDR